MDKYHDFFPPSSSTVDMVFRVHPILFFTVSSKPSKKNNDRSCILCFILSNSTRSSLCRQMKQIYDFSDVTLYCWGIKYFLPTDFGKHKKEKICKKEKLIIVGATVTVLLPFLFFAAKNKDRTGSRCHLVFLAPLLAKIKLLLYTKHCEHVFPLTF